MCGLTRIKVGREEAWNFMEWEGTKLFDEMETRVCCVG